MSSQRHGIIMLKTAQGVICSCLATFTVHTSSLASDENPKPGAALVEMEQFRAIFPGALFGPGEGWQARKSPRCEDKWRFLGYLGWAYWAAFRDTEINYIIDGRTELQGLKPYVRLSQPPSIGHMSWAFSNMDEQKRFAAWFPQYSALRHVLASACGQAIVFSNMTHAQAIDFWEQSLLYIWCLRRHANEIPPSGSSEPVGATYAFRKAMTGNVKSCPAERFPAGLLDVVRRIQSRPGTF